MCVCVQQRLAWLDSVCLDSACFGKNTELVLFTAHWLQWDFYSSCPLKADTGAERKTPAQAFWVCYKQRSWRCRAFAFCFFFLFFFAFTFLARSGLVRPAGYDTWSRRRRWRGWRSRTAWIHRGTGQGRLAGSACHGTAEGERRQQLVPFSFTGTSLMILERTFSPLRSIKFYCNLYLN